MTEDPVIIAAIISTGISSIIGVSGIILTQWFNYRQRKDDADERYFYEIYRKRLALYEEVCDTLSSIGKSILLSVKILPQDFINKIPGDVHTLFSLSNRLNIYGSLKARKVLNIPIAQMCDMLTNGLGIYTEQIAGSKIVDGTINMESFAEIQNSFFVLVSKSLLEFAECAREETGSDFVNKKIREILEKKSPRKKLKKEPRGEDDTPIN